MATLGQRMAGAAMLDIQTYEEVERDKTATAQALLVVLISSAAAAIGGAAGGVSGILRLGIAAVVGWVLWAAVIYLVGAKVMPEPGTRSDIGELLRTTGFASSPGVIRILGFVPLLGWIIQLVAFFWMLAAMVIAVRQALDYTSTVRAAIVCIIGWFVSMIAFWLLAIPGRLVGGL